MGGVRDEVREEAGRNQEGPRDREESSHKRLLSRRVTQSYFFRRITLAAGMRTGHGGQVKEQGDQLGWSERWRWAAPGTGEVGEQ